MPYDISLDKQLFDRSWGTENNKIIVSVHSYKDGPKKLQIIREVKNRQGKTNLVRIGRLSKEELQGILPLIQEALTIM